MKNVFRKLLNQGPITVSLAVVLSVLFVTGLVNAATTISTNISTAGTLTVDTTSTLTGAVSMGSTLVVAGDSTLASTTATSLKVAQVGTRLTQVIAGYCVTTTAINATNASSTQTYATCTPSGGVTLTGTTANRVFVQATSSLPFYVVVQAASSTAAGLIQVALTNFSTSTTAVSATYAFNFWAFQ